jgi:hypothetical protein
MWDWRGFLCCNIMVGFEAPFPTKLLNIEGWKLSWHFQEKTIISQQSPHLTFSESEKINRGKLKKKTLYSINVSRSFRKWYFKKDIWWNDSPESRSENVKKNIKFLYLGVWPHLPDSLSLFVLFCRVFIKFLLLLKISELHVKQSIKNDLF